MSILVVLGALWVICSVVMLVGAVATGNAGFAVSSATFAFAAGVCIGGAAALKK